MSTTHKLQEETFLPQKPHEGQKLSHYRILHELGQGGMSIVYKAYDEHLEREVAIKVLHSFLAEQNECRQRLSQEALIVAKLQHPNIVQVYDYSAESLYIVTELVQGATLQALAQQNRFYEVPEIGAFMVWELAQALHYAHCQGVIHRDIKPENIMVSTEGVLKLMDFGIAHVHNQASLTLTGSLIGSPAHMAPEIIEGQAASVQSDIFSLCTILYWLMTGELPFKGSTPHTLLHAIATCQYTPSQHISPCISDALAGVLHQGMAKNPADRFSSAQALADALEKALGLVEINTSAKYLQQLLSTLPLSQAELRGQIHRVCLQTAEKLPFSKHIQALSLINRVLADNPEDQRALRLLTDHTPGWLRLHWGKILLALGVICAITALLSASWNLLWDHKPAKQVLTPQFAPPPQTLVEPMGHTPLPVTQVKKPKTTAPIAKAAPLAPKLVILIKPFADVFVDNRLVARDTRTLDLPLTPGKHTLVFKHRFASTVEKQITIPAQGEIPTLRISLDKPKPSGLLVQSNVSADVALDGHYKGETKLYEQRPLVISLPDNTFSQDKEVVFSAAGYKPFVKRIQFVAGEISKIKIDLVPQ